MVLDLTPEQEAQIRKVAAQDSRSLSDILTSTAVWLLKLERSRDESLRRSLEPHPLALSCWSAAGYD